MRLARKSWCLLVLWLAVTSVYACTLGPPVVERPADVRLLAAVAANRPQAVLSALKQGAQVNFRAEPWGLSPLIMAARLPAAMTQLLLAHGAQVNLADVHGRTALMKAVYRGNVPVVRLLLIHGAAVNASGPQGKTALFYAIVTGRTRLVRLLMAHGSALNVADDYGETPLSLAQHMLAAARAISPMEQKVMMAMRPTDSMFMRSRAQEIQRQAAVLRLLQRGGAVLPQQPARSLARADACRLDEQPAVKVARPGKTHAPAT